MRAKLALANGNFAEMRTPSEVKQRMADTARMATRLEILSLTGSREYMELYAEYRLLNWYINQKPSIRKLTVYNYWMFGAIPDIGEEGDDQAWSHGFSISLDWLLTCNTAGLIADSLPVQQSF
jgi:hypothetical protein